MNINITPKCTRIHVGINISYCEKLLQMESINILIQIRFKINQKIRKRRQKEQNIFVTS